MTSSELLKLAGVLTKDPDNNVYTEDVVFPMFTAAQDAIAASIHPSYLRVLRKTVTYTNISDPGDFTLPGDFLRPLYLERLNDGVPIEYIEVEYKGILRNKIEGGTDLRPKWFMYSDGSGQMTGRVLVDTYPISMKQYYIRKPSAITMHNDPVLTGLDNLLILYFKHLFHLAEGQAELAGIVLKSFEDFIVMYNERAKVMK